MPTKTFERPDRFEINAESDQKVCIINIFSRCVSIAISHIVLIIATVDDWKFIQQILKLFNYVCVSYFEWLIRYFTFAHTRRFSVLLLPCTSIEVPRLFCTRFFFYRLSRMCVCVCISIMILIKNPATVDNNNTSKVIVAKREQMWQMKYEREGKVNLSMMPRKNES